MYIAGLHILAKLTGLRGGHLTQLDQSDSFPEISETELRKRS